MRKDVAARLIEIVGRLEQDAEITAACGLHVATKLLRMARLDLLCHIHDVSDCELRTIGDQLERKRTPGNHAAPLRTRLKPSQ